MHLSDAPPSTRAEIHSLGLVKRGACQLSISHMWKRDGKGLGAHIFQTQRTQTCTHIRHPKTNHCVAEYREQAKNNPYIYSWQGAKVLLQPSSEPQKASKIYGRDSDGTMNGMETIEARFLSTFSQQIMGTIKPYDTHVVSCHHARNKRTIVRAWEIVVGDLILGSWPRHHCQWMWQSVSLHLSVAEETRTSQCCIGHNDTQAKWYKIDSCFGKTQAKLNYAATVRNMLTRFYKLLQVNLVLTRTLFDSLSYCWSLVFRISSQGSSTHQDAVSV